MQISKQLQDFIEVQFQEMCRDEKELPKERERDKRRRERERKRRARELNRGLKTLAWLKDEVDIKGLEEKLVAKARRDNEEILGLESKCNPLYGKGRPDFNGFLMRCYYLIKKETDKRDVDIFRWIVKFLEAKEYIKAKRKNYTVNDLKQIVYNHFENYGMKSHYEAFFDHEYADFLK